MSESNPLTQKKCQPCEGINNPYNLQEAMDQMSNIPGWELHENGKDIFRTFVMKNFMAAVDFIGKISEVAEAENHHPDIHLTEYRNLRVNLSTHAIGGLSENDFILASKINELLVEFKK